jgi:hypothetical protein
MTDLERTTQALQLRLAEHDKAMREASERRGSVPPPELPGATLTHKRIDEMGRAMLRATSLFSAFSADPISPLEMLAFIEAAKKGVRK